MNASNLQRALKAILDQDDVSGRAFASKIGVNASTISRLDETRIDANSLAKVLSFFAHQPDRVTALLRAHLWDEIARAGVDPLEAWTQITGRDGGDFSWFSTLPPGLQADLEVVGTEARNNRGIALSLEGMAHVILRAKVEEIGQLPAHEAPLAKAGKSQRKNTGAPTARPSLPPRAKAS